MSKMIGIVKEVFIPQKNKIDIMNATEIGFKVCINNKLIEIVQKQNEINTNIYKNDKVLIIEKNKNGQECYDIELFDEAKNESI